MIGIYDETPEHLKEELKDYVVISKATLEKMAVIVWNMEDVQTRSSVTLSDDIKREVLASLEMKHDAEYGVNWDTISESLLQVMRDKYHNRDVCTSCNGVGYLEVCTGNLDTDWENQWCDECWVINPDYDPPELE